MASILIDLLLLLMTAAMCFFSLVILFAIEATIARSEGRRPLIQELNESPSLYDWAKFHIRRLMLRRRK